MNHTKKVFFLTIGAILIFAACTFLAKCHRSKPVNRHQENREEIMKSDSLLSVIDTHYRARIDSLKEAYQDTLQDLKGKYKVIVQKDVRIEYRYRDAPNLASCDSVIDSKNMRIGVLETINRKQEQVSQVNDSLISSYAGSLRAKDQTIHQLNAGYDQATKDLQKALKPRRWGIGAGLGYGAGPSIRPGPVVFLGLSYNLIRF